MFKHLATIVLLGGVAGGCGVEADDATVNEDGDELAPDYTEELAPAVEPAFTPGGCDSAKSSLFRRQTLGGVTFPTGTLSSCVDSEEILGIGDGRKIRNVSANWTVSGNLCAWRVDVQYRNTRNQIYKKRVGSTHGGACLPHGNVAFAVKETVPDGGRIAVALYASSGRLVSVNYHDVHK